MPPFKLITISNDYMCRPILHGDPHETFFRKYLELPILLHSLETTLTEDGHVKCVETRGDKNA
jgi:hypothetical protein